MNLLSDLLVRYFFRLSLGSVNFEFGFCDIRNSQGLGKCESASGLRPRLISLASTLIISDITKTSSNNCLLIHCLHWDKKYIKRRSHGKIQLFCVWITLRLHISDNLMKNLTKTSDNKFKNCSWLLKNTLQLWKVRFLFVTIN